VVTANTQLAPRFPFAVVLSNPQAYEVQVQLSGGALTAPVSLRLNPGAIQTVVLPWVLPLVQLNPLNMGSRIGTICFPGNNAHSTLARGGAYHVHANGPIAAYQFNPLTYGTDDGMYYSYTNDASLLLPQSVLTRRYTVSTWPNWLRETEEGRTIEFGGFVAIAAVTGEVTTVTVRPRVDVSPGEGVPALRAGGTYRFELSQGDVLQLLGTGRGDLSGSTVEASNPVAVFVGHDCTNVPFDRVACDHLEEQLLPDETWGRDYLVSALRDRGPATPSVVRVLSRADGNALTFEPAVRPPTTLDRGRVLEFSTAQSFRVRGSEPFLVTQFMIGQGGDLSLAGDPAMVQEVPVQQFRAAYDFFVPGTYPRNFLNIVAPADAALDLDGTPARGSQESVGGLTVYYLPISAGPHRLRSTSGQFFGIKVYGVAPYTSYMYPGGLDLQLLTPG
jgi:hypothetical protein